MASRRFTMPSSTSRCSRVYFADAARFSAQRFLVAAMIARLPAAESFRFGFVASGAAGRFLDSAHLFRCAAAIAALPALLILRRLRWGNSEVAAVDWEPPSSICRFSASALSKTDPLLLSKSDPGILS